jgi:hypothetical protein
MLPDQGSRDALIGVVRVIASLSGDAAHLLPYLCDCRYTTSDWTTMVIDPVEGLLDRWQQRDEQAAIALLLPAWRGNFGLTDGWTDVLHALHELPVAVALPDDERKVLASVAANIEEAIRRRR